MIKKTRILGVAPYESLKNLMLQVAAGRNDIELTVYVEDLENGAKIARNLSSESYDVIISRGGTALAIRRNTQLPVISISISVYDILRAIRLADNFNSRYAIVGFPSITEPAHLLCDLLHYSINIITINNESESEEALSKLQKQGYSMVICDTVTHETARRLNMNAILITSGLESISDSFDRAVEICRNYSLIREENLFLRSVISGSSDLYTVVMDEDENLLFSTWPEESSSELFSSLHGQTAKTIASGEKKFFRTIDKRMYSTVSRSAEYFGKKCCIFYLTPTKIPLTNGKYGIHFNNMEEVEDEYENSFLSLAGALGTVMDTVEKISGNPFPVLLSGEKGSGKSTVSSLIYLKSKLKSHPFIRIDCDMLNDRNWDFLLNNYNSPFTDNDNTICFNSMEKISEERHKKLLLLIMDTGLARRNRLIFSFSGTDEQLNAGYMSEYLQHLSCLTLHLSPLRLRKDEIPPLAALYLSRLNIDLGKQLIGFEPQALNMLENFSWPSNYTQFRRVLMEAALESAGSYIRSDTVAKLIESEMNLSSAENLFNSITGHALPQMSLNDMIASITKRTLMENEGNQSKTARQLGISRTTLWRYINRVEEKL